MSECAMAWVIAIPFCLVLIGLVGLQGYWFFTRKRSRDNGGDEGIHRAQAG